MDVEVRSIASGYELWELKIVCLQAESSASVSSLVSAVRLPSHVIFSTSFYRLPSDAGWMAMDMQILTISLKRAYSPREPRPLDRPSRLQLRCL
jgi:hypothetical protein